MRARARDPHAELKTKIHRTCIARLGSAFLNLEGSDELARRVREIVVEELNAEESPLSPSDRAELERQIADDILGYGPLEPFLHDPSITEVMVNGSDQVFVERGRKIEETEAAFLDDAHLLRIIDRIVSQVGRRIDESSPMVDARLPDGSRVNAIIPPLALQRPVADDPEVRKRRPHARAPRRARLDQRADGRLPRATASAASSTSSSPAERAPARRRC